MMFHLHFPIYDVPVVFSEELEVRKSYEVQVARTLDKLEATRKTVGGSWTSLALIVLCL
jgi:hypothetical protein